MKASERCSRLYVSQPRQLKGLSASVLVLDRKFLEGRECVCSTTVCAINVCLKRKDQTSGTTEMSENNLNYMDKATNPQKNPHPETHYLPATNSPLKETRNRCCRLAMK